MVEPVCIARTGAHQARRAPGARGVGPRVARIAEIVVPAVRRFDRHELHAIAVPPGPRVRQQEGAGRKGGVEGRHLQCRSEIALRQCTRNCVVNEARVTDGADDLSALDQRDRIGQGVEAIGACRIVFSGEHRTHFIKAARVPVLRIRAACAEPLHPQRERLIQLLRRPLSPAPEIAHLRRRDDRSAMRQGLIADQQNEHREHAVDVEVIVDDEIESAVQSAAGDELETDLRRGVGLEALRRAIRNPMTQFDIGAFSKGGVDAAVAVNHPSGRRPRCVTTRNVKGSLQVHSLSCLEPDRCSYHCSNRA